MSTVEAFAELATAVSTLLGEVSSRLTYFLAMFRIVWMLLMQRGS